MGTDFPELLRRLRLDITGLANTLQSLFAVALLKGRLVAFTVPAGAMSATAIHGLSRAYQGGFVVSSSDAVSAVVQTPGNGSDRRATLLVETAPAVDTQLIVWVF